MIRGRREGNWRSMDRRKFGDFRKKAWMEGLEASIDSFYIRYGEVPFDDDATISDHYSPALTLALTAYHLALLRQFASC